MVREKSLENESDSEIYKKCSKLVKSEGISKFSQK